MNKDKVYLKGYVIGRAVDTLGYNGLMVQLENLDIVEIDKNLVHKGINEPQKVTVPQFVADWIEVCKEHLTSSLYLAMTPSFLKANNQSIELILWIKNKENQETFALAWINGYEVKKEKRYLVKIIGIKDYDSYLNYRKEEKVWTIESKMEVDAIRTGHTRKELEEAGFGWVFDCEGMEVEEVEG